MKHIRPTVLRVSLCFMLSVVLYAPDGDLVRHVFSDPISLAIELPMKYAVMLYRGDTE